MRTQRTDDRPWLVCACGLAGFALVTGAAADVVTVANPDDGDDTQAISDAFDAAGDGGTVVLAPGVYTIHTDGSRAIDLRGKKNVTLLGAGAGDTVVRYAGGTGELVDLSGATDLSFRGFTLDGAGRNEVDNGFVGFGGSGHVWNDVEVRGIAPQGTADDRGFVGFGIYVSGVHDITVSNSRFENVGADAQYGAALRVEDGDGVLVSGNRITNTGRNGIVLKETPNGVITDNTVRGTGTFRTYAQANGIEPGTTPGVSNLDGLAIELFGGDTTKNHGTVIQHNTVDHWISIDRGSNIAVRDNVIDGGGSNLVQLIGLEMAGAGHNVIFAGNVVKQTAGTTGNQYVGLAISNRGDKNNILIADNTFDGLEEFALQLQGNDDPGNQPGEIRRIVLAENSVLNTQADGEFRIGDAGADGQGIRLLNGVFDATFIDNVIRSNGNAGVVIGSVPDGADELAFVGNTITANGGDDPDLVIDFGVEVGDNWPGEAVYFNDNTIDGGEPNLDKGGIQPLAVAISLDEDIVAGEEVTLSLNLDPDEYQALWDVGEGLPLTGTTVSHAFTEDQIVRVAVWQTSTGVGGYLSFKVVVVPEPLSTSSVFGAGLLAMRRRRH